MFKLTRNSTLLGMGLAVSGFIGWLLLKENKRERDHDSVLPFAPQRHASEPEAMPHIVLPMDSLEDEAVEAPTHQSATTALGEADDLTKINDIGPRFANALKQIGITRFAQLAELSPDALAERLAPLVTVRAQRIATNDWIGQASRLAKEQQ